MQLTDLLINAAGGSLVKNIAAKVGISEADARRAMGHLAPAVSRGIQKNSAQPEGLESLINALGKKNHRRYIDQPDIISQPDTIDDGNAILGHIFGKKDISRNVAGHAAQETGLSSSILKKLMPMIAAAAMGAISQKTNGGASLRQGGSSGSGAIDIISSVLDSNRDGSMVDDLLSMATKFF